MDVFAEIKAAISMQEVAERYGFEVKRGMMCCPLHNEKTPSLKVYPGDRGWHCFGCNEGGSVIDFVAKLGGVSAKDAAAQLDKDFGLGLFGQKFDNKMSEAWRAERERKKKEREAAEAERWHRFGRYLDNERAYLRAVEKVRSMPPGAQKGALLGRLAYMEYWLDAHWADAMAVRR